jgi:hypothetical protein
VGLASTRSGRGISRADPLGVIGVFRERLNGPLREVLFCCVDWSQHVQAGVPRLKTGIYFMVYKQLIMGPRTGNGL